MSNEEVLIQALTSIDYETAKVAIKSFYKATIKDKATRRAEVEVIAKEYAKGYTEKKALPVGETVITKTEKVVGEKSVVGTEELAKATCPRCGDSLEYSAVCPACAAGKAGYPHRYSCVCGVSFVVQEKL